jgi:hypothetical protein
MSVQTVNGHATPSLSPVTNAAKRMIELTAPYVVETTVEGTCPILFHRWSCEAVAEKAKAKKGSAAKKTDDVESYVYRRMAVLSLGSEAR